MLIKAAQFYFSIFNIHCPNLSVLEQLKTLLKIGFLVEPRLSGSPCYPETKSILKIPFYLE
jgi:hypothetical protein